MGNGMASTEMHRAPSIIHKIRTSPRVEAIDIWELILTDSASGRVDTKQMLNYFSIGVDAEVALDFERCRTGCCRCCFCCQCMSLCCYVPVGAPISSAGATFTTNASSRSARAWAEEMRKK